VSATSVKIFNTTGAGNMAKPGYKGGADTMFFAGDDAVAKQNAARLAADCGFKAVDASPLKNVRLLEPLRCCGFISPTPRRWARTWRCG
jgi:predicted dinucleotide-binding enzyme